jgi:hypothetical protein
MAGEVRLQPSSTFAGLNGQPSCRWCPNTWHGGPCPRVEELEFHENGSVKRVKFRGAQV